MIYWDIKIEIKEIPRIKQIPFKEIIIIIIIYYVDVAVQCSGCFFPKKLPRESEIHLNA